MPLFPRHFFKRFCLVSIFSRQQRLTVVKSAGKNKRDYSCHIVILTLMRFEFWNSFPHQNILGHPVTISSSTIGSGTSSIDDASDACSTSSETKCLNQRHFE